MNSINLLAASRERPERLINVLKKWIDFSSDRKKISIIISIDSSDSTIDDYKKKLDDLSIESGVRITLIVNDNKNTVEAINRCKSHIDGDLIFIISDDTDCFPQWDKDINDVTKKNDYFIIKTSDGIGTDLITMPIFSRGYLENKDYIYYPEYEHMFCDTELTCVASIENCVIDATHLIFKHLHYTKGYNKKDEVDLKNQDTFYGGMDIFKKRMDDFFGIKKNNRIGVIPQQINKWIIENYHTEDENKNAESETDK
jgi:hypothetical protein